MAVKYGKFEIPQRITFEEDPENPNFARFVAEPFERGFGHTIGSSMRRVMLSSLEAPAIISLRIEGVPHEYMAVEGIVEDLTNIVLNLKGALLRRLPTEDQPKARLPRILTSVVEVTKKDLEKGGGQVSIKLGDLISDPLYEVVNPELHLFFVTAPMKRQIDLKVAIGRGYVSAEGLAERFGEGGKSHDEILIDAAFSPVRLVNYFVESTRVGQDTDLDRLIIEGTTDGRIAATEALGFAAQIGVKHFEVFENVKAEKLAFDEGIAIDDGGNDEIMDKLALRINEIELSVRSTNCLSGANIETIAELVTIPERKMLEFRNFGKKSLNEIKAKLMEMGLSLGMDLTELGITQQNVREVIGNYLEERGTEVEQAPL